MADSKTDFRLQKIEEELGIQRQRAHDALNTANAVKLGLEDDREHGEDREKRLRGVEAYIEQHRKDCADDSYIDWRLWRTEVLSWATIGIIAFILVTVFFYIKAEIK